MIKSFISKSGFYLIFLCCVSSYAQEIDPDSLESIYLEKSFKDQDELALLKNIASYVQDPQKKLEFGKKLFDRQLELDSSQYLYDALMQQAEAHYYLGDYINALSLYQEVSSKAREADDLNVKALSDVGMGDVYAAMGDHDNAIINYNNAIPQLRLLDEEFYLAIALLNAGDAYLKADRYDSAENFFKESEFLFSKLDYLEGEALNQGNLGLVYAEQGKIPLAEAQLNDAIITLEEMQNYYAISFYMVALAEIYLLQENPNKALDFANNALSYAKDYELLEEVTAANKILSETYEQLNDNANALIHFKEYILLRDSLEGADKKQEIEKMNGKFLLDLEKKEKEAIANYLKISGGVLIVFFILASALLRRNRYINKTRKRLDQERQKSNKLLLNILPEETAAELRENGSVKAKKYNSVTVLFTDFSGFTKLAENLPPEKLVETVGMYFSEFDRIMEKYDIEKIKTLGDAYMCASGLPVPNKDHASNMIQAASEILSYVIKMKEVHSVDEVRFDIKIGIHSGPVVAGVVGESKFAYDIWGDTVNIAARMETTCEPGKINVSAATFDLVKDKFKFESRGSIEVKNRGMIDMYYLQTDQ